MQLRPATSADAEAIAAIHAASWRSFYRGALSDAYLAGDVVADRIAVWSKRLGQPGRNQYVVLAEMPETPETPEIAGRIAGFGCAYAREHPEWGSLLDNLHVTQDLQGKGLGVLLLRDVAAWCTAVAPDCPLYLWVLEINVRAQAFYRKLGAVNVGHDLWASPDGGAIPSYRFAWERPSLLLERAR